MPVREDQPVDLDEPDADSPWVVVVWNDPINLIPYVTLVLQKLFGYSKDQAAKLTMQVHNEGRAAVSSGTREQMETDAFRLQEHGLWATIEQG